MHQPFYKDVVRNSYVMPWAYLHGAKDYFGMAALSMEFPNVHQTFNLVPSLLVQLDEYARGEANDPMFDLAFKPVEELTESDRATILEKCFPVPVRTMVQPFQRYFELYERRSDPTRHHEFTDADYRDIQVWWTLAWVDHDRRPREFIQKGRHFSEGDKAELRKLVLRIIADVTPAYRKAQEQGVAEISTTPFYHPILPILVNSRVDDSHVPVDMRFPEDAKEQLVRARDFMRERFGRYPRGLWPSEGSVSDEVALLASSVGFKWMATDEGILAKSGVHVYDHHRGQLFQPYERHGVTIFFRDRGLSDLIGFHYMHASPADGARDLIAHFKQIPDGSHVSIILDGENPWDYYPNSGRDFLRFLFDGISKESGLEAVPLSEAAERLTPKPLEWLAPGSWANANFNIWIGHPEDHQAWEWIARARSALMDRKDVVSADRWNQAYEELLVAEGSDWMWWFGNDFSSDSDAIFDSLFRQHIANIYYFVGLTPPEELRNPIKKSLEGRHLVMAPPPAAVTEDPR